MTWKATFDGSKFKPGSYKTRHNAIIKVGELLRNAYPNWDIFMRQDNDAISFEMMVGCLTSARLARIEWV